MSVFLPKKHTHHPKGHKESFGGDVYYLDCGDHFTGIRMLKPIKLYTLATRSFM